MNKEKSKGNFADPRGQRTEGASTPSKIRGGKLHPVGCVPFSFSESGIISQEVSVDLEPVAGRLMSDIIAEVVSVYVPALACDEILGTADYPGNTELFRERILAGEDVFPLEVEGNITKAMGVEPVPIEGQLLTSSITRLAHNAAVTFLRKRKYAYATPVDGENDAITPALLSSTALDLRNGVLQPEDRTNGAVKLEGEIPIRGIGLRSFAIGDSLSRTYHGSDGVQTDDGWYINGHYEPEEIGCAQLYVEEHPELTDFPNIRADFGLGEGQQLSLKQFMQAERQDAIVRQLRRIVDANPEHGEEMITRFVHGLELDTGKLPWVVFNETVALSRSMRTAMDGDNMDKEQTSTSAFFRFSAVVPKSEFGGVVITFLSIKPEEVISSQPHPILSQKWSPDNFAADQLVQDPVPVLARELDSEVDPEDETVRMMYMGNHHLRRTYSRNNWARDVNPDTIEHRNAIWRYKIPMSVSPDNVVYPETISHDPFVLNLSSDPVASYTFKTAARILTPTIYGPSPIEEVLVVETDDIFEEQAE